MRVAQRTINRNYLSSMNSVLERRADALRRSEDGLRFTKLSEDVAAGARAMETQETRYAALQQKNTAEALLKETDSAWTALGTADGLVQDVLMEMKSAAGVRSDSKLYAIKTTIGEKKAQYLQSLNSQYGSKYLFGGTNNATPPFTDEGGKLCFNGVPVASIYKFEGNYYVGQEIKDGDKGTGKYMPTMDPATGKPQLDPATGKPLDLPVPQSGEIYLDVGYGLRVGSETGVDPRTAIKVNTVGLEAAGFQNFIEDYSVNPYLETKPAPYDPLDPNDPWGSQDKYDEAVAAWEKDKTEWDEMQVKAFNRPNNIYDLISEVEERMGSWTGLSGEDSDKGSDITDNEIYLGEMQLRLTSMNDQMRMARTEADTRSTALEDMIAKLTDDITGMEKLEDSLMTAQPAGEAINLKNIEYAWKAVLAVGNQLLPSSLLDYLR